MKIVYIDNDNYWKYRKDKYKKYMGRVFQTGKGPRVFSADFARELEKAKETINAGRAK